MRVCFISNCILPSYNTPKDGNTFLALEFPRCLGGREHSLIIGGKSTLDNYDIEFLNQFDKAILVSYSNNKIKNSFTFYRALKKIIKTQKIDILHLINTDYLVLPILCKLFKETRRLKLIYTISMPYFEKMDFFDHFINPMKVVSFSHNFDGLFATTPYIRDWLISLHVKNEKIFMISPPIDCKIFKPINVQTIKHGDPASDFIILFIGEPNPLRFPAENVLESIKRLKYQRKLNVNLLMIDRYHSDFSHIHKIAKKKGINENIKIIHKSLSNEEKVHFYNLADAVIFPFQGVTAVDPPITLLEAMSSGSVVLSSKIMSAPFIIKNKINGLFFNSLDPGQMAEAVEYALTSERRNDIGIRARETILRCFSKEKVAENLTDIYYNILNNNVVK